MAQKALITGASSGIGKELALVMAANGHDLVLAGRDMSRLLAVKAETERLGAKQVSIRQSDLSLPGSAMQLYQAVKDENIGILVNNAGTGLRGDFFSDDLDRTVRLAQLNMISPMELMRLFGNDFIAADRGRILNVASIVAFLPGPKQPVYYATKAFLRSLSRSLAYNLRGSGVTVTAVHPGITRTGFFEASGITGMKGGATASKVAELAYQAMMSGKIEVTEGMVNKLLTNIFVRVVPYRWQAPIVDKSADA